ncbi:hypothetical protein Nepgr_001259 [Nepenthes gracilis]|uniref:Surfeit locus protein 6 n=1 Tax=Nepenthes gracilis TaxID=150966 RepID=A0AAD3RXM1_NEPGR|nr:hypothetical protein Nepgr_001259 [Nepenthes gracilis]
MKKKKPKTSAESTPTEDAGAAGTAASDGDIKSLIHGHALFFDKLIELIPAKFYLARDTHDNVWFKGLSKAAKKEAKQKSLENMKKARRDRLDPEKSSRTTLDLLKESLENENSKAKPIDDNAEDLSGDNVMEPANFGNLEGDRQSVTYEELRQRLHKKIEELREGRGGGGKKENEKKEKKEGKKRKRNEESIKRTGDNNDREGRSKEREMEKEVAEAAERIQFGKLKLAPSRERGRMKKKRKLSKEEELERAVKFEEEAKKDPMMAKKYAWKAVTDKAMGIKVHDDPKLLKASIKKEGKRHDKSVKKWKERVDNAEMKKREKQEKRKENIRAKIDKKKKRKIEKREKKLMRPGFEGRKEGFINAD